MGFKVRKRWDSCFIWFIASLTALGVTLSCINAKEDSQTTESTSQDGSSGSRLGEGKPSTVDRKLMLVSTLDGKLSVLDIEEDVQLLWSMAVDSRPLLSSSISKLEIMDGGVMTRYIPSLDGNLYKFDGESIEAVPMSADSLLSSTYKLGDNTMMLGGKDILSYGIDPNTGQIRYACGVKGCHVFGENVSKFEDLLMVTRNTKTVRGVDASSGLEKWNFSVGQHDVKFIKGEQKVISSEETDEDDAMVQCQIENDENLDIDMATFSDSIKIVVPEGMVVGVDPANTHSVTWQFKFKSPISNAWILYKGELQEVGMFDNKHIPGLSSFEPEEQPLTPPLLYVGMHQGQLYVQQSNQIQEQITEASNTLSKQNNRPYSTETACARDGAPKIAWKPYLNTAQWRTPALNNRQPRQIEGKKNDRQDVCENRGEQEEDTSALTIWHENYPFDNGFYLYPEFTVPVRGQDQDTRWSEGNMSEFKEFLFEDYYPVTVTLWTWWKEVVAISSLTSVIISFVVHFILTQAHKRELASRDSSNSMTKNGSQSYPQIDSKDNIIDIDPPSRQNSDDSVYVSRYYSDFDHIQLLGKGGFGVVFESKNKVDECHYAVKRIAIPNSEGARERVMREVKTLAKLDHIGIVRYFNAWIECPPVGWQEEKDQELEFSEVPTSQTAGVTQSHVHTTSYTPSNYIPGSSPKSNQVKEALESLKSSPKQPSPLDFLQNPFGGNLFDYNDNKDGDVKRGGSEEFTAHSQSPDLWSSEELTSQDLVLDDDESGSFSCLGTPKLTQFQMDQSDVEFVLSDSEFSNNNSNTNYSNSNIPFSDEFSGDKHDFNDDSVQIVFEDSGCGDKSSKESSSCNDYNVIKIDQSDHPSEDSVAKNSISTLSVSKNNRSRTHSRSQSKDLTKLTYEREGKHADQDKDKGLLPLPKLYLFIQMQLCKHETLKDWLTLNTLNRDRRTVLDIFDQITSAIQYVHELGLMHRDLKPSNIFFSLDGMVKMGDFGLVTALPEEQGEGQSAGSPYRKHTARVGTQLYMSPEQNTGKVYTQKVDIYALGVILFELLYPFATQMERVRTLLEVRKRQFPERFAREMKNECTFVKNLLSEKPEDRPTAEEILSSELLSEFEARRIPRQFRTRTISQNSS